MKISDTNSLRPSTAPRRKSGTSGGGAGGVSFAELLSGMGENSATSGASAPAAPVQMNPLFALQEVSEQETQRHQTVRHGDNLLESLDSLRTSLLMGRVPLEVLKTLDQRLRQSRSLTHDPALHAIIDDIELRAAVELAKLERAFNERNSGEV